MYSSLNKVEALANNPLELKNTRNAKSQTADYSKSMMLSQRILILFDLCLANSQLNR